MATQKSHKLPNTIILPEVTATNDGRVCVVFGEVLTLVFDSENAGKFARWIQDTVGEIECKRQQKIPQKMVTAAATEGNPLRKAKKV